MNYKHNEVTDKTSFTAEGGNCNPAKAGLAEGGDIMSRLAGGVSEVPGKGLSSYPNPFSGTTMISYELEQGAMVNLTVFNVQTIKLAVNR